MARLKPSWFRLGVADPAAVAPESCASARGMLSCRIFTSASGSVRDVRSILLGFPATSNGGRACE